MLIDLVESDLLIPFRVITLTYFEDLVIMSLQSNNYFTFLFRDEAKDYNSLILPSLLYNALVLIK